MSDKFDISTEAETAANHTAQYEELIINAVLLNEPKLTDHGKASKADAHLNLF
jgi:hypothetical protein